MVEGQNLGVEVADGHIIMCSKTGIIKIQMLDNNEKWLEATLSDVMYVPGLSQHLFSITKFAQHGHYTITSSLSHRRHDGSNFLAADFKAHKEILEYHAAPSPRNRDHSNYKKRLSLELLHRQLGHRKCCTLLATSEHQLWQDKAVCMSPETGCLTCGISTIHATARNKEPHTGASQAGEHIFIDILHPLIAVRLTPSTT